jgi:hypothetical protein
MDESGEYLTIHEAAKVLGVPVGEIRQRVHAGTCRAFRVETIPGMIVVSRDSLGIAADDPALRRIRRPRPSFDFSHMPLFPVADLLPLRRWARPLLGRAANRAGGCGCVALVALAACVVFALVFAPWAFVTGGGFTPLTIWRGYGPLDTAGGAHYLLYLDQHYVITTCGRACHGSSVHDIEGTARLCTARGQVYRYDLSGVSHAWLRTDGSAPSYALRPAKGEPIGTGFELSGQWRGGTLSVSSAWSFTYAFRPDGTPYGATPHNATNERAAGAVMKGDGAGFAAACQALAAGH